MPATARKRWTRDECEALETAGLLDTQRLELIEGDLIDTLGQTRPHAIYRSAFHFSLGQTFGVWRIQAAVPITTTADRTRARHSSSIGIVNTRSSGIRYKNALLTVTPGLAASNIIAYPCNCIR